jgi:hypothetical protein
MVKNPDTMPPLDPLYRSRFDGCRPYIRSGEDYVVAHDWAERSQIPASQSEFDASLTALGTDTLADLKSRLYRIRDDLLANRRSEWLSWNPLYPGMVEALNVQSDNPAVWILSTKKASFIAEILKNHGVFWPEARTVYTGTSRKLDLIPNIAPDSPSVLIDDQIDHLDFSHPTCRCYLALWGYASPEATLVARETVSLDQALDLIRTFPRPLVG